MRIKTIAITLIMLIMLSTLLSVVNVPYASNAVRQLWQPTQVYGAGNVYYVATTGSDAGAGTIGDPWETINYAATTVVAGDTVYIRQGSYSLSSQILPASSGALGNVITYENYQNEIVDIDGSGLTLSGQYEGIFYVNNKDYITVDGLRFNGSNKAGLACYNAGTIVFENCYITNTDNAGICARSSNNVVIYNNDVEDCVQAIAEEAISLIACWNFEVSHNYVYNMQEIWNPWCGALTPQTAIDVKVGCHDGSIHHNTTATGAHGIYIDGYNATTYNIDVYNNHIYNFYNSGISMNIENDTIGMSIHNISIYNNIIHDPHEASCYGIGIMLDDGFNNKLVYDDIYIVNNTLWNFNTQGLDACPILIYGNANPNYTNLYFVNNIFWGQNATYGSAWYYGGASEYNASEHFWLNNIYGTNGSIGGADYWGSNYVTTAPTFVNAGSGCADTGFELVAGSSAIGTGISTYAPSGDYVGTTRPQNSSYDIGAYEYYTGAGDQAAVLADTSDATYVMHPGGLTLGHTGKYTLDTSLLGAGNVGTVSMYIRASVGTTTGTGTIYGTAYLLGDTTVGPAHTLNATPTTYTDVITKPGGGTWTIEDIGNAQWWVTLLHNIPGWVNGVRCQQMHISVSFLTSGGSQHQVTRTITVNTDSQVQAGYDGATQYVSVNGGTTSQVLAAATIFTNTSNVHVAEFDGRIDDVRITSAGTTVLSLDFEPEDIGAITIQDKTTNDNDATFTLASNDSCQTVEIGKSKSTSEIIPLVTELEKQEYIDNTWHDDKPTNEDIDRLGQNNPFFPIVDMIYQFSGISYWMSWMSIYLLVLLVSVAWVLRHTNSHIAIAAATGLLVTCIFYAWGGLIPWGLVAMWVLAAMLSIILERRQTI